jgi:hypothetical protein
VGLGGVFVEVFKDAVTVMPPVGAGEAKALLARLKGFPLLAGARGRPKADLDALAGAIAGFSAMAAQLGDVIAEADVNPVIAGPAGALAVDALILPKSAQRSE